MLFNIYTDGSCRKNGLLKARGAWGYVVLDVEFKHIIREGCGKETGTTNQKMELRAVLEACKWARSVSYPFDAVHIYTDSAYIHNCITDKWYDKWLMNDWKNSKHQPVANRDLWEQLIPYFEDPRFRFFKVGGHQGVKWNEYVDKMVQNASQES